MDIVERLRKFSAPTGGGAFCPREMAKEAADEIENLRGEITFLFHSIEAHQKEIKRLRELAYVYGADDDEIHNPGRSDVAPIRGTGKTSLEEGSRGTGFSQRSRGDGKETV